MVVTPAEQALAPAGLRVAAEPDLVLGTGESADEQFFGVRGLREYGVGQVIVADGFSSELRRYDGTGALVARFGGSGSGPGEFATLDLVPAPGQDSLLVWDADQRRMHVVAPDGSGFRVFQPETWHGRVPPIGATGGKLLVGFLGLVTVEEMRRPGVRLMPRQYAWHDASTGGEIPAWETDDPMGLFVERPGRPPLGAALPFAANPTVAVGLGTALLTQGPPAEIRAIDVTGRMAAIYRIDDFPVREVSDSMIEAYVDARFDNEESRAFWMNQFSRPPVPDTMPAFEALLVDAEDWLWARLYRISEDEPQRWVLFDPEGVARGTVKTPTAVTIHRIAADAILGVQRDSLQVERVVRYPLSR
ncbi:MAG: hypothetical protein WEB88_16695 [Gemmatimonadota bacterium]